MKSVKISRVIVLLLLAGSFLSIKTEDLVVAIDSLVKIVNQDSECNIKPGSWRDIDDTCKCCIVKNASAVFGGTKSARTVVRECLQSRKCDQSSGLMRNVNLASEQSCEAFVHHIFNNTVVVKQVRLSKELLNDDGKLKPDVTKRLLVQAYNEGKLDNRAFSADYCLQVRDMLANKGGAWNTLQLFMIESQCAGQRKNEIFFLKEMKTPTGLDGEVYKLVKSTRFPELEPITYPNIREKYPSLIFPIAYLSYKDQKGKSHELSLMQGAHGKVVSDLIKDFANNPTDGKLIKRISFAYFDIGVAMAHFYKRYAAQQHKAGHLPQGIIHGDLHAGNIFYDHDKRQIFIIDNESIARSLDEPKEICKDIAFLLMKSIFVAKWVGWLPNLKGEELNEWYQEWFGLSVTNFIVGFLSTYPKNEVKGILRGLEHCIKTYATDDLGTFYTNNTTLGVSPDSYITPILERLNAWFDKGRFIAADVDVDAEDDDGKTLLFKAASEERLLMWPLVAAGANVNYQDGHINTPMHDAAWYNKPKAIKVLYDAGANINSENHNDETPLYKARYNKNYDAVKMLEKLGAR